MRALFLAICCLAVGGCATVYTADEFESYQARHEAIGILPYVVSVDGNKLPEGMTASQLRAQEREEAYLFQRELYSRFLRESSRGRYTIEFQDIQTTNVLLERAGIGYEDLRSYTNEELASVLGTDAVISGAIQRSQPMGTGGAIASALLIGFSSTNKVNVSMQIHDGATGSLLWNYDHEMSGGLGSSPESVAEDLMRSVARRFPYTR